MTLTEIIELKDRIMLCSGTKELSELLDEYGEDNDPETVSAVYKNIREQGGGPELKDGRFCLRGKDAVCPDCRNSDPDKILSSSSETLVPDGPSHFGCCECGTQFVIE